MARPYAVDLREQVVRRIDVNLSAKRALSVSCAVKLIHILMRLERRGRRKLIMTPEGVAALARKPRRDETLVKALVRAHRWRRKIESGQAKSITDLAAQEGVTDAYICRLLPLTCLAPDIVEAILDGRQPRRLKLAEVLGNCSLGWEEQRCTDAPGRRSGLICLGQDMQSRPPGCDCGTIPRAGRRAAKSDDQMMDVTSSPAVPGGAEASVRRAQHADHRASPLDRGRRRPRPGGRAVPGPPGARPRRPLRQDVGPPAGCPGGVTASS